jgi:putative membrane protein insertion efficiency factor
MKYLGIALVRAYQLLLGPLFAGSCKYHPSCSQYALDALREHGLVRGSVLAGWRLLRCNPWSRGGVDHAVDQTLFRRVKRRHA